MSRDRQLPWFQTAIDLALQMEQAVRRFPRDHKLTLGTELCQAAQRRCWPPPSMQAPRSAAFSGALA